MKTLITGGAGFIGSHLARLLLGRGDDVVLLDDLSTGRKENIDDLIGPDCTFRHESVGDVFADPDMLRGFDQVYHLAAAVGVQLIVSDPVHTIETNVMDTALVLRSAAKHQVPVLVTSSSEVYGKSDKVPFSEDDDVVYGSTLFSRWSYAVTKAIDEYLAIAHYKQDGLPAVVVRLFNTVGPRQVGRYGMVVPRFVQRAVRGKPIEVYGDGEQSRCFCHVSDVVGAMPKLLSDPKCHGRVFNLGSDREVSINQLADRVIELTGSEAGRNHRPYDEAYGENFDDLRRRVPNLSRIRDAIGYEPTKSLDEILTELIELERAGSIT